MQFLPDIFKGKKGASLNLIFEIMTLQAVYRLVTSLRGVKFEEDEGVWHSNHHFSLVFFFLQLLLTMAGFINDIFRKTINI